MWTWTSSEFHRFVRTPEAILAGLDWRVMVLMEGRGVICPEAIWTPESRTSPENKCEKKKTAIRNFH